MQQIQKDHEPLAELVTREYPLPIALAYRRMIRAKHAPYEQVGRRATTSLVRLWWKQGKRTKAHQVLAGIYNWFTEGFESADLIEAKALLEELSP